MIFHCHVGFLEVHPLQYEYTPSWTKRVANLIDTFIDVFSDIHGATSSWRTSQRWILVTQSEQSDEPFNSPCWWACCDSCSWPESINDQGEGYPALPILPIYNLVEHRCPFCFKMRFLFHPFSILSEARILSWRFVASFQENIDSG